MADIAGNIPTALDNAAEAAVLAEVPTGATTDQAELEARIAETANGILGGNVDDPRYKAKGAVSDTASSESNGTATGTEAPDDSAAGAGAGTGEAAAEEEAATEVEPPAVQRTEPQAPAEVAAKDYSLTVKGADTVDAEGTIVPGKEYKVEKIEDLPEDFTPQNNRQILQIIQDLNRLEATKATDEAVAATVAEQAAATASQAEMLSSWDAEIQALQDANVLDKPKLKAGDPKYLTDPAMKKVADVFDFMEKTNKERTAAGNPNLIRSFADAYDKLELVTLKAAQAQVAKDEADTAKLKAGAVGGGSAGTGVGKPPVYVAGAASEIGDLLR